MPAVEFVNLLVVAAIAFGAPLLVGLFPKLRVPAVVLEILAGVAVGPSGLGLVEVDLPVQILALLGLAFVLFLAGLEIDAAELRGPVLRLAALGFVVSLALGVASGLAFGAADLVRSPLFVAIALAATSLGLVVPVLKDAGQATTRLGQLTIAGGSVADFATIVLLTLFFSTEAAETSTKLLLLGGFVVLIGVAWLALVRVGRSARLEAVFVRLQDTTAEIRVRLAILLLVAFVALAEHLGLELILGAFLAGAILNVVDRDTMATHPHFHLKLEAIGYGFLVPVFFVTSGLRFDLEALLDSPSAFARIPLCLVALLVVRGVPAVLLYRREIGTRPAVASGLLQATSLPFIVTATQIGLLLGEITPVTAAALVSAGLLSVILFPPVAVGLMERPSSGAPSSSASTPSSPSSSG